MPLYCSAGSKLNRYVTSHICTFKAPAIIQKLLYFEVLTIVGEEVSGINCIRCKYTITKEMLFSRAETKILPAR